MKEITLQEYLLNHSQTQAADLLGVNQSAISQMLKSGRDIRLRISKRGTVIGAFELKPIGRTAAPV